MRGMLRRGRLWLVTTAIGGNILVLEGCDPTVRNTVLGGVESSATTLSTTFIQAFFESLLADDEADGGVSTV